MRSRRGQTPELGAPAKPARILLVEDNASDTLLVREALEEHSVEGELIIISNGERAIEYVKSLDTEPQPCPALVILDWSIPRRSGADVLAFLRASVKCFTAPVVVLTSSDRSKDREDAARLGASRYLQKPTLLADFLALGAVFKDIATP